MAEPARAPKANWPRFTKRRILVGGSAGLWLALCMDAGRFGWGSWETYLRFGVGMMAGVIIAAYSDVEFFR